MHEVVLRDFFLSTAGVEELRMDLEFAIVRESPTRILQRIEPMEDSFTVESKHLVRVCEAVISGELPAEHLRAVGFCLQASDAFIWDGSTHDGERVANVASDWSSPEINFALTLRNVERWRSYLLGGEYLREP